MMRPSGDQQGRTALSVAAVRASETEADHPLFTDPYAHLLLAGAGQVDLPASGPGYPAARTKWFDDYVLAAGAAGVSQVVVLDAGLDTRAWRLPWLSDAVVFDVDEPAVLAHKTRIMDASDAQLGAKYVPVPAAVTDDWPKALREAGFDHNEPTAWLAESLLPDLDDDGLDTLLEQVALYSARGSRIAVEATAKPDVAQWLRCHRWDASSIDARDVMHRYHRDAVDAPPYVLVCGTLL
ncbi:SAM-dependent methyltransferase [Mycobacterium sp. PSTR-4-N]|uniref:SAM-dependent methyltransferase n=1 Tax=Mycobacterium sp. PSTR-4-N TaxID=2917745 RepID=UPI001F15520D|nr:SAM-dependent methyltransferase [Mycobacterium sp. PSTR-4-N]MCG7596639.1 SAM-dependent methyltransferase [Mycobacterium sp. PSTR-4-N]